VDAFAAPEDLGPPSDSGAADLGAEMDLGRESDGGLDLGAPRPCAEGCAETEYCQTTNRTCLDPDGECRPKPDEADCLAEPDRPVCGCDYRTYRNDCAAAAAGVVVAFRSECPAIGETDDWCDVDAPVSGVAGCFFCYDDDDCEERTETAFECVGSTCSPDGVGRCAFNPPAGDCYYDFDCRDGEICVGAELLGCGDPSGLAPVQGECR